MANIKFEFNILAEAFDWILKQPNGSIYLPITEWTIGTYQIAHPDIININPAHKMIYLYGNSRSTVTVITKDSATQYQWRFLVQNASLIEKAFMEMNTMRLADLMSDFDGKLKAVRRQISEIIREN